MPVMSSLTLVEILIERLRGAAKSYNPSIEEAPVCVLWTDPQSSWQSVIPMMIEQMPELLQLGKYKPEQRQGPILWMKWVLAGELKSFQCPKDRVPVLYLPKISREELRHAEQCSPPLQSLVELLYRGVAWVRKNGYDWNSTSFFKLKEGLGWDVAQDESTRHSLQFALPILATMPLSRLAGRRLEARDFDTLIINDLPRELLHWIALGDELKSQWNAGQWHAFCSLCREDFDFDPQKKPPLHAAKKLGLQEQLAWQKLWERFSEAPEHYEAVRDSLSKAQPTERLMLKPQAWPSENVKQENALRKTLESLSSKAEKEARHILFDAEKEHGKRRDWVWAKLGEAPLALAMHALNRLAEGTRFIPNFESMDKFVDWYSETGWEVDAAVLEALRKLNVENEKALTSAIAALYEPWLQALCLQFQSLTKVTEVTKDSNAFLAPPPSIEEGECILFVDGLRLDIARWLAKALHSEACEVMFKIRLAALPTITASAKPAVSPIANEFSGDHLPADFLPNAPDGKPLSHSRFQKCLRENGFTILDLKGDLAPPNNEAKGWCETGKIDRLGHNLGIGLASALPDEMEGMVKRVDALLNAGWKAIQIVTDHGWLLLPGGLKKHALPEFLTESRWTRCAAKKGESKPEIPSVPWRWNPNESVLIAPGACAFIAKVTYSHGGLSPQECVLPELRIIRDPSRLSPRIVKLYWRRLRCHIEVENAFSGLLADLRTNGIDPASSACERPKEVESDGQVSLLVIDEDLESKPIRVVLFSKNKGLLAESETRVGA